MKIIEAIKAAYRMAKAAFHGKGVEPYRSRAAKRAFAKQQIDFSGKLFFVGLAPSVTAPFVLPDPTAFAGTMVISSILFIAAGIFRHEGLKILDSIEAKSAPEPAQRC